MPTLFCDIPFDVHLGILYHLELDDLSALRKVRCPSPLVATYIPAHLLLYQCNRILRRILDQSSVWNYFARRLVLQGTPLPYEGLETDKDLSTQDLKRIVLKAFYREKAWSHLYAIPKSTKIHTERDGFGPILLEKIITSDLLAIISSGKLKILRLSDFSSVDVYDFPDDIFPSDSYFKVDYDHRTRTIYAFVIAKMQKWVSCMMSVWPVS